MSYLVGLDLGQSRDCSALVIVEQQQIPPAQPTYAVRHLYRWPLDTPYPRITRDLEALLARPPLAGRHELVVDQTGCGRPLVDQLRQAGLSLIAVSLHGGDTVSQVGSNYRTPKRDLVGVTHVLLQQHRLQFAEALPLAPVLTQELLSFKVKIDPATAHESYSAWREKDHDDLVLALALALWWGERTAASRIPGLSLAPALDLRQRPMARRATQMPGQRRPRDTSQDDSVWAIQEAVRRRWGVSGYDEDDDV